MTHSFESLMLGKVFPTDFCVEAPLPPEGWYWGEEGFWKQSDVEWWANRASDKCLHSSGILTGAPVQLISLSVPLNHLWLRGSWAMWPALAYVWLCAARVGDPTWFPFMGWLILEGALGKKGSRNMGMERVLTLQPKWGLLMIHENDLIVVLK